MSKRKPSSTSSSSTTATKKKKKPDENPNQITNYYASPVSTASHVGLQSASLYTSSTANSATALLDPEQIHILHAVVEGGKSIFFTGAAGTGKSLVLTSILQALYHKYRTKPGSVAITASTGIAATNIGGTTLHAWGSLTSSITTATRMIEHIRKIKGAVQRWRDTQVLVVDEVSMIEAQTFDIIDSVAKTLRRQENTPLGGMQLVLTGDFFQLPPIPEKGKAITYAFESKAWRAAIQATYILRKVHRQKDPGLIDMLNDVRDSRMTALTQNKLRSLSRPLSGTEPATELYAHRAACDAANAHKLEQLTTPPRHYTASDTGKAPEPELSRLLKTLLAPPELTLKVGAQVMLVRNIATERGLCNGAIGIVRSFEYAPTGPSFKKTRSFSDFYVAHGELLDVTTDSPPPPKARITHDGVSTTMYPVVRFYVRKGEVTVLLKREAITIEDQYGTTLARRRQVPLMLAWAISIHKSQGQTLHRVVVNLSDIFQSGQAYVALSRASTIEGLQVKDFKASKITTSKRVVEWFKSIQEPEHPLSTAEQPVAGPSM